YHYDCCVVHCLVLLKQKTASDISQRLEFRRVLFRYTGGSGDVLSGVAGTLLAQTSDPFVAGALGAFVHGRAAERVVTTSGARGIALEDVVKELRHVWDFDRTPSRYPVLAELPAVS